MSLNRRRDTRPEMAVRSELHRRGLRFRRDFPVRTADRVVRPDVVFTRWRVAVFVDGCFWHRCPEHGVEPRTNVGYWTAKLDRNVARDRAAEVSLRAEGWIVLRAWEHEDPREVADRVTHALGR